GPNDSLQICRCDTQRQIALVAGNEQGTERTNLREQPTVHLRPVLGGVHDQKPQVRIGPGLERLPDTDSLDFVARFADARGIDESQRNAPDAGALGNEVAGSARSGSDDGAIL